MTETTDDLPRVPGYSAGQTVHNGTHDYVSTYCQHARTSTDLTEAAELHLRCRQTCKVCGASCGCACHRTTELLLELRVPGGEWYPFRDFVERCHVPGNVEVRLVDGIEDANQFPVLHLLPHQSTITFERGSRLRVVVQREGGPHRD